MRASELAGRGVALLLVAACAASAGAQERRAGGAADPARALARAQALLRQVGQEKAAVEARNVELQARSDRLARELDAATGELERAEGQIAGLRGREARLSRRLATTRDHLDDTVARLREAVTAYRDTRHALAETTAVKESLDDLVARQSHEIQQCEAKNLALYEANQELLERYENKGAWEALLQSEPVTGLKQVQIENILEEYRDRLFEQRYRGTDPALVR